MTHAAEQVMARSGKTFYRAAQLLPRTSRESVIELYGFCRLVDDLADESTDPAEVRAERLQELESALRSGSKEPITALYGWTPALACRLGETRSAAAFLVHTAMSDLYPRQPADEAQLERYAFGVAGTVGLMLCELLQAKPEGRTAAAHLGIAMQLSNIARDVAADLYAERIYLPADWISSEAIQSALVRHDPVACQKLCIATRQLLALAEVHYRVAFSGMWTLPWRVRWSILAAAMCYREIGIQVGRDIAASWRRRTTVSALRKGLLILCAAFRLLHPRFWRSAPIPASSVSLAAIS